jgi:hypothetical protein
MPAPSKRSRAPKSPSRIPEPITDVTASTPTSPTDGQLELRMAMLTKLLPALRVLHRKRNNSP